MGGLKTFLFLGNISIRWPKNWTKKLNKKFLFAFVKNLIITDLGSRIILYCILGDTEEVWIKAKRAVMQESLAHEHVHPQTYVGFVGTYYLEKVYAIG